MPKGVNSTFGMPNRTLIMVGLAGAGLYLMLKSKASAADSNGQVVNIPLNTAYGNLPIQQGTQNIPELPGNMAPTSNNINTAAQYWANMAPVQGFSSGYINFPSGSQAAAALFPVRADVYGSPYVQWAGQLYILMGPDSSGNYNATQVMV